jgi:striatin 1/3/4
MNPSGEQCYSGGLDSIISVWNIPNSDVDPYDSYGKYNKNKLFFYLNFWSFFFKDSNVLCKVLEGHTDAVWQLVISGQKLLSSSSDGSIRLWDPNLTQPLQSIFNRMFFFIFRKKKVFLFR